MKSLDEITKEFDEKKNEKLRDAQIMLVLKPGLEIKEEKGKQRARVQESGGNKKQTVVLTYVGAVGLYEEHWTENGKSRYFCDPRLEFRTSDGCGVLVKGTDIHDYTILGKKKVGK